MGNDSFLTARQVMARYGGMSNMTLWRWVNQDKCGFPQPIYVNRRRLWSLSAIEAWERSQAREKARPSKAAPTGGMTLATAGA